VSRKPSSYQGLLRAPRKKKTVQEERVPGRKRACASSSRPKRVVSCDNGGPLRGRVNGKNMGRALSFPRALVKSARQALKRVLRGRGKSALRKGACGKGAGMLIMEKEGAALPRR